MRNLTQSDAFTRTLAELPEIPALNSVLTGIAWAVTTKPEVFSHIPGSSVVRFVKSEIVKTADGSEVRIRVWFKATATDAELLRIEAMPEAT